MKRLFTKLICTIPLFFLLSACGLNEENIKTLENELGSNEELGEYFTDFYISSNDKIKPPLKQNDYKIHYYGVIIEGTEKFVALSDNGKLNELEELGEAIKRHYTSEFIACGKNTFCDIHEIFVFDRSRNAEPGKSDMYSIKFKQEYGIGDYIMEVSFYDENGRFQQRTVSDNN